jgi:transcriptional regulator with XRE-family HTH domain
MLKTFQLRAARSISGIGVREAGKILGVSHTTVSTWEQKLPLDDIKSLPHNTSILIALFEENNIFFNTDTTISFNTKNIVNDHTSHLTRFQLRVARTGLGLTQERLAAYINIPKQVIAYLESKENNVYLHETPKLVDDLLIKNFFEKLGLNFLGSSTVEIPINPRLPLIHS